MDLINWNEVLGWSQEQLLDLRSAGFAYLRQGKFDVAKTFFEALVAVNEKSAFDVQTLGAIYLQMGDAMRALEVLQQALELDPQHQPTLLNKAKGLLMMGNLKEGLELAKTLEKSKEPRVANLATALVLANQ